MTEPKFKLYLMRKKSDVKVMQANKATKLGELWPIWGKWINFSLTYVQRKLKSNQT